MRRLRSILAACAFLTLALPTNSHAQPTSTTCYVSADGGMLGLKLPAFKLFQQLDAVDEFVRFLETDTGSNYGPLYGARIGWVHYDPSTLNGVRIEARGFFSERTDRTTQRLPAGTVSNQINGAQGTFFTNAATSEFTREVSISGGDFFFKWDTAASNRLIISTYVGPSILDIDQRVDILATENTTLARMTLRDDVKATYWGASAGVEFLSRIFPTTTAIIDARFSVFDFRAERQAQQTDTTGIIPANIQVSQSTERFVTAASLRCELVQQLRWCQIMVFGTAQYLDAVPYVDYGRSLNSATEFRPSQLETDDAFLFTGGLSICFPF